MFWREKRKGGTVVLYVWRANQCMVQPPVYVLPPQTHRQHIQELVCKGETAQEKGRKKERSYGDKVQYTLHMSVGKRLSAYDEQTVLSVFAFILTLY